MLEEYKDICRQSADLIPDWKSMSKNDLCRAYVKNKDNPSLQNCYLSAILYRYWNLISKYYYMSVNCATPEDCYEWLVDSVCCCVNLASWENPDSSIYKDPNGPDKVINRCMKCARLTYYQFINRKKRRDNFGLLSIDELKETFGNNVAEPIDYEQTYNLGDIMIKDYIVKMFNRKDYFVAFLVDCIVSSNIFDISKSSEDSQSYFEFNLRKLVKVMNTLDEDYVSVFAETYDLTEDSVLKGFSYVRDIPEGNMRKKILQCLETLKHSDLIKLLIAKE